jgi:hypothetical protein
MFVGPMFIQSHNVFMTVTFNLYSALNDRGSLAAAQSRQSISHRLVLLTAGRRMSHSLPLINMCCQVVGSCHCSKSH